MHLEKAFLWDGQACSKASGLAEHRQGRRSVLPKSLFHHSWQMIWKCFWIPSFYRSLHSNNIQQPYSHSHLGPRKCLPFLLGTNPYTYMTHYYLKILQDTTWKQHLIQAVQTAVDLSLLTHVVTNAFCGLFRLCRYKSKKSFHFRRATWLLPRAALIPICELSSASEF